MLFRSQSGNPGGRPKAKPFRDALMLALMEKGEQPFETKGKNRLRLVAEALIAKAMIGDTAAAKEVADRTDGKVPQGIVGDDEHSPVRTVTRIELVDLVGGTSSSTPET